jgi:hypothetical protein
MKKTPKPMSRNKWKIATLTIAGVALLLLFYFVLIHKPVSAINPIQAVPLNASVIIKVNDFSSFFGKTTEKNELWTALKDIPGFAKIDRQLRFIDSLSRSVPDVRQILENSPSFLSLHLTGKDKICTMYVFRLPAKFSDKRVNALISGLVINTGTTSTRKYEGFNLHEVVLLNRQQVGNFSYAVVHNNLLLSFSTIVLEDAIRQVVSGESVTSRQGFQEAYATAGKNVDANVFVNFQQFPRTLSAFVKADYKAEVRSFRNFAEWAEMDVNLLRDMFLLNGFVFPLDSVPAAAGLFANQSPQRITADEILPASVAAFLTMTVSDPEKYFYDYKAYLQNLGKLTPYLNSLRSLTSTYGIDFLDEFMQLLDNEFTLAFDAGDPSAASASALFLMRVKSHRQAEDKLSDMVSRMARMESRSTGTYYFSYKPDNELNFRIGYIPVRKLTAKVFGNLFASVDKHYFIVLDNYLVFSSSIESVKSFIYNNILNRTLLSDPAYQEFRNNLSPRSNVLFYCNLGKGNRAFSPYLTETASGDWDAHTQLFQHIQALGMQMYSSSDMLHGNILVKYLSTYSSEPRTVWESKLDAPADFKPAFVVNHITGKNEVFVQDLQHNIYLINQVGRILWKMKLPEAINSDIFQVDFYRNGKLQLLFSTRNNLYLIDRNGNMVEKYPVQLRSPATCGLSVFDYDNNRNYRLFIACEDRNVYLYDKNGKLIPDWKFDKTESEVNQSVNHFRFGGKDYLVFGDRFRTYILNRRGETRAEVKAYFPKSSRNGYYPDFPGGTPGVVTTDTTGKVYFIHFDGVVSTLDLGSFSAGHFFDYQDLNGDGSREFIFLDENRLTVFGKNKSRLFHYDFNKRVQSRPAFYQFSTTDRKLGAVSRSENLIYLINNDGKLYAGFPLRGNTPFSIGNFGDTLARFNLVTGSEDGFLYNYRVQ